MVWPLARRRRSSSCAASTKCWSSRRSAASSRASSRNISTTIPARSRTRMVGKRDENGERLVPWTGELVADACWRPSWRGGSMRCFRASASRRAPQALCPESDRIIQIGATRTPYFCSGCPHNRSTKVPGGIARRWPASVAISWRAGWTAKPTSLIQMGGEGVNWARLVAVHRQAAHLPEPRRRHLLPFRLDGDPPGDRGRGQHHLQDPLQRRRRDDRRPAGRRADQRAGDCACGSRRGRRAYRAGLRRAGKIRPRATSRAGDAASSP